MSLALALALPLTVSGGAPFPHRSLVVFLVYAAVLLTLVPAGFTLGPVIDRLGLAQGAALRRQLAEAHASVLHAALEQIEAMVGDEAVEEEVAERLRALYVARLERLTSRLQGHHTDSEHDEHGRVRRSILAAERRRLAELTDRHAYPTNVLREITHQLDLEESRRR